MTSPVFDAQTAADQVVAALLPLADPERAAQTSRYLKSDLYFLGVRVPGIRAVVTDADRTRPGLGRDEALAWARALWGEPVHERRIAAIELLFIRKAIGWVLREAAKKDPAYVAAWTRSHLDQMSGVTFTEAVRRLPAEQAARLRNALPGSPEPAANDYATREANQFDWGSQVTFPFAFAFRAELETRAGGNPSWNTGVNHAADLAKSADLKEVRAAGASPRPRRPSSATHRPGTCGRSISSRSLLARHPASAAPIGVHGGPWTNGQISSAMQRQSAVADSSPRSANRPRLIRCRIR